MASRRAVTSSAPARPNVDHRVIRLAAVAAAGLTLVTVTHRAAESDVVTPTQAADGAVIHPTSPGSALILCVRPATATCSSRTFPTRGRDRFRDDLHRRGGPTRCATRPPR